MKGHVDKSRGMETLMTEALAKINPTETFRLAKQAARKNETDQIPRVISGQSTSFSMSVEEKQAPKGTVHMSHGAITVFTGMNTIGSGRSAYNLP
jgi:hypothetical protein